MKGYVFISNSTKPNAEKLNSRDPIVPKNVSRPCLLSALDHGYKVIYGTNRNNPEELSCELPISAYDAHTYRSITAVKDNLTAIKNLNSVLKNNDIEVIHCNTPVGGLVGRLCGKKHGVKYIIYTAHGFHFYKGAPLINRTLFKWAEKIMAHWTDAIITMNEEDYQAAKTFKLRNQGKVYKVHGVGINLSEFESVQVDVSEKRREIGVKDTDFLCISAGDLNLNKNYHIAIRAIANANDSSIHYAICGKGSERQNLENLAKELGVQDQIHFLGYRNDMKELLKASDLFLNTSFREGLPRSLMEAMASGLPVVASKIRGNTDLIEDGVGGYLHSPDDEQGIAKSIKSIADSAEIKDQMIKANLATIKEYDVSVVAEEIKNIYDEVLPFY